MQNVDTTGKKVSLVKGERRKQGDGILRYLQGSTQEVDWKRNLGRLVERLKVQYKHLWRLKVNIMCQRERGNVPDKSRGCLLKSSGHFS